LYRKIFKPVFDKVLAFVALLLTLPVIVVAMLLLAVNNRGKVWFVQPRPGKYGKIFRLIKFKTMTDKRDAQGDLLPDDDRLTPMGILIRKSSIDELPQLLNVLKGDMSFVGPRPLLVEYLPLYNTRQMRRHEVKPGITGWAQVNGRNAISWQQKFENDIWYVDNQSFWLDLKILFLTIRKVFIAEGISGRDTATMKKFTGNN
jgi:undecaprenyl phosphate N,N'-diacetylbacillosamine 1-phosphate transferase